jgi:hypothetical protein
LFTSAAMRVESSRGILAGPQRPYQDSISKPGSADSETVVRHHRKALGAGDGEELELAALGERVGRRDGVDQGADLAGEEVGDGGRGALARTTSMPSSFASYLIASVAK